MYKTRLVTKGYAQTYGIDYEEIYILVIKMIIIRVTIIMVVIKGCKKCFFSWRFIGRSVHGTTTRLCGPNTF